jgi:hypothetical protein
MFDPVAVILGLGLLQPGPLTPLAQRSVHAVICCSEEVATLNGADSAIFVRVLVATEPRECYGPDCDTEQLFVGVTAGDYGAWVAYELPPAREWSFVKWLSYPKASKHFTDGVAVFLARRVSGEQGPDGAIHLYQADVTVEVGLERAAVVAIGPKERLP